MNLVITSRRLTAVLTVLIALLTIGTFAFGQELLNNGSFDSQEGWTNCGDAANWSINAGTLSATGTACVFQAVPAVAGTTYTLSCNPSSTAIYSTIALSMLNSNFGILLQDKTLVDSPNIGQEISSLVAPTGTAFVAATIYSEGPATHEACSLVASGITAAPVANTVLVNPEFDSQEGWVNCADAGAFGISGGQLNMFGNACVYQTLVAEPGMTYTLSCSSSSTATFSTLSLSALASNYGILLQDVELVNNPEQQTKQSFLTAPAGTSFISVTLYSEGNSTHGACFLSF